ncbi:MAG: NAD-dependent deacylase [Bacteroidota bacterium]|mgnify:FL=1|nr:NAD-dependent deacylase [Bacteroidota bacterium]MDX5426753.1 NAD-dependent deacylase [Bacteroidota bacterium]MDX5504743.1 NAD-dependent deacylase [Bacteroidota bacterium]
MRQTLVVFSGAGMSADSGLKTFRDHGGLWEEYNVYDVATPEAWDRNPDMVTRFYNMRRKQLLEAEPNAAHKAISQLEKKFDVRVITQNIDDLHERAGSSKVLHLHGELRKVRSSIRPDLVYEWDGWEVRPEDVCELGSRLRPHVVWFGEEVPMMLPAMDWVRKADLFLVIGSSLNVYPAAGLLYDVPPGTPILAIDPGDLDLSSFPNAHQIRGRAAEMLPAITRKWLENEILAHP